MHRGAIEIPREESGLSNHGQQPLERPHDGARPVGYRQARLPDTDGFGGITSRQMIGCKTEVSRNDRRDVESALAKTFQRPCFITARDLPRQVEVFLRFFIRSPPQVYQPRPDIEPRQQHPLVETLCLADRALCCCNRSVPVADS